MKSECRLRMFFVMCIICCFLSISCTTVTPTKTGFLKDYSHFKESIQYKGMLVDSASIVDIGAYDKFMIETIEVYSGSGDETYRIESDISKGMIKYFYAELVKRLMPNYTLVNSPGEGVLCIRVAITDIVASKPLLNIHWSTKLTRKGFGGASVEAEFLDSLTRERIAAVIHARQGRMICPFKGYSKWGYSRDALLQFAQMLVKHLDVYQNHRSSLSALIGMKRDKG
ncbi:DUF3313 domain-containing protein [Candidatus Omnitrophota bacterium]